MTFTLVFTVQQISVLYQRGGTSFTTTELKDHQEYGYSFGPDDGFRAAFSILDNSTPDFLHRDGLLKMEVKQIVYEYYEDGTFSSETQTIPTLPCTQEDIDMFYPLTNPKRVLRAC